MANENKGNIQIKGDWQKLNSEEFEIIRIDELSQKKSNLIIPKSQANDLFFESVPVGKYVVRNTHLNKTVEIEVRDKATAVADFRNTTLQEVTVVGAAKQKDEPTPVEIVNKDPMEVKLVPASGPKSDDQALWSTILRDKDNDFSEYQAFINFIFDCAPPPQNFANVPVDNGSDRKRLPFNSTETYSLLKFATERFVRYKYRLPVIPNEQNPGDDNKPGADPLAPYLSNSATGSNQILPYYKRVEEALAIFVSPAEKPCDLRTIDTETTFVELIWNYWHEEGKVNETVFALLKRFQNVKNGFRDPLANFELDPLRPLNNILWGYIQDYQHRLTPARRNYEYEHHYGLRLATTPANFNPADRRSKFLQSFHRLLYEATEYFVQSDNTIIRPDGFKLLNALRDTHRIISEGAHNQFGDMPVVARIETLIEQWILARPEIREFLGGRVMVAYEEPWMDRVDSMKALQGWDNTSVSFYRDLAVYGEKIILGIRYGDWTGMQKRENATNWADAFRDAIQRYIHSYYTVTGIDIAALNVSVNSQEKFLLPGILIQNKLLLERERRVLRR